MQSNCSNKMIIVAACRLAEEQVEDLGLRLPMKIRVVQSRRRGACKRIYV